MTAENARRGKRNKQRGTEFERELVNVFKERGLDARRCALSGQLAHEKNDVLVVAGFDGKTTFSGECKRKGSLPNWLTEALDGADFAAFRQDRGETLIVLRAEAFADLLQ